jgi:hypothetical protein
MQLTFYYPFCMTIAGPSKCRKTQFVTRLLHDRYKMITPSATRIIYCYSIWQSKYDEIKESIRSIDFFNGIPDTDLWGTIDPNAKNLIVLDDLMAECIKNDKILNLFTVGAHHYNISTIFISQKVNIREQ